MKLSVVMAVRNGERHLGAAIDSVLAQSFGDFECLVVDDASTDATPAILEQYARRDRRLRIMRNDEALGPYPSANRGLEAARGDYIARHDADDISPSYRLAIQLDACADPSVALVAGAVQVFGARGDTLRPPAWQPRLEWDLLFGNVIGAGGHVMFPRVVDGVAVRFPCRHRYAEDYALWCALSRAGRVACPSDIVYRYRRHEESITSRRKAEQDRCVSEIRAALQSRYLATPLSLADSEALSRFWSMDAALPAHGLRIASERLAELEPRFMAYVAARYGAEDAERLAREVAAAQSDRLGYWMFRAIRSGDASASAALSAIAHRSGQVLGTVRGAAREAGSAVVRKVLS